MPRAKQEHEMLPYYSTARSIMKGVKLNMARAKKLPSGNWRVQAMHTDENGITHRASFTEETAAKAEAKAALWQAGMFERDENIKHVPLGDAIDEYIETCRVTGMSPATVRGYSSLRNNAYASIINKRVDKMTARDLQIWINQRAQVVSPKTLRNGLGLLQSVLKVSGNKIDFSVLRLPKPKRTEMEIPDDQTITTILNAVYDDDNLFIAISLAALMGLRRSEIAALRWADISITKDGKPVLHVNKALVMGENGAYAEKDPKTSAGTRDLVIPSSLYEEIKRRRSLRPCLVSITPNALSIKYSRLAKEYGAPTRFHSLRHYHASVMLREGVPEKYIIADMGHSSFDMVKRVYGHVMEEKIFSIAESMNTHATAVLNFHTVAHTGT